MKNILTLVCLFFAGYFLQAQDTIKVQTFDWKSTNRRDTFSFPDNSGEKYRKILMTYNMRCHDAAVGSGSVGCREWDYSCNTYIYDPSKTDSTMQFASDYVISNFKNKQFAYTNLPTYTYYAYQQHNTSLSGNLSNFAFGTGNEAMDLKTNNKTGKIQTIFTAAELTAQGLTAGPIIRMQLDILSAGTSVNFLKIKMKGSNKLVFDVPTPDLDGFTEVYFKNSNFVNAGLNDFNFYQPFVWNGTDNILIELSYSTPIGSPTIQVKASDTGSQSTIFSLHDDNALSFNGAGDVVLPNDKFQDIKNELSISFWCYGNPNVMPAQSTLLEATDANNARQVNIHLPWDNSNVYWDCGGSGGGYDRINKQANKIDFAGKWNYWAFTKDAVSGNMKIYLNGALWHSGTGMKKTMDISAFKLGNSLTGSPAYFGSIDELRIWNKALDAASIANLMNREITPADPEYSSLVYAYNMNEGAGTVLNAEIPGAKTAPINVPTWNHLSGTELYKNFDLSQLRFNATLSQGDYTIQDEVIHVLDSVQNAPNRVIHYGVVGSTLTALDTSFLFQAGQQYVYDESGAIIDSVNAATQGTINIGQLTHYVKRQAKFEILSLVTPYGNSLNLGQAGKTFTFDVTDYAPILKGKKVLSIENGGENQEELDIKFLFIKGTPAADVVNIQNIWPPANGYFNQIQTDVVFEPRNLKLAQNGMTFKVKAEITGHGQNGEFTPREHYIDLDGGTQEFPFEVWKTCAKNPIFPQGGTWVFDRAGWCPGAPTNVHELYLDDLVNPGQTVKIDYGVNGPNMTEANYLVSNQLISYGTFNYKNDAAIENISRPNNQAVEFERLNPACNTPTIFVRNTGSDNIQSIEITYGIQGGTPLSYTWTGEILPLRMQEIVLPVTSSSFWFNNGGQNIFSATILKVNGKADEYAANNTATSTYSSVTEYSFTDPILIQCNTNLKAVDNSYTVKDGQGNVILARDNMTNSTGYTDEIDVPDGCYTFDFEDSSGDGLSFWFFPDNGTGSLRLQRLLGGKTPISLKNFNPDMGGGVQYDFIKGKITATHENLGNYTLLSLWPNPASTDLNLETHGFEPGKWDVQLSDLQGKVILKTNIRLLDFKNTSTLDVSNIPNGMYFLHLNNGKKTWVKQVVIQR